MFKVLILIRMLRAALYPANNLHRFKSVPDLNWIWLLITEIRRYFIIITLQIENQLLMMFVQ